jgi:hypothetical protein
VEEGPKTRVSPSDDDDDDDGLPVTQIRGGSHPPALTPADPKGAAEEAAAASDDSDGGTRGDEDAAPARRDTVSGYEANPADGIHATLNPHATLPATLLPLYIFLHMDAEDPARCGPLKRPEFAEDHSADSTHNSMLQPVLGAALSAGQVNAAAALVYQAKAAHAVSQQGEYGGWWCAVS